VLGVDFFSQHICVNTIDVVDAGSYSKQASPELASGDY